MRKSSTKMLNTFRHTAKDYLESRISAVAFDREVVEIFYSDEFENLWETSPEFSWLVHMSLDLSFYREQSQNTDYKTTIDSLKIFVNDPDIFRRHWHKRFGKKIISY